MNQRLKNNTMKTFPLLCLRVASAAILLIPLSGFSQGSLNPPGSPAPTMKRLDELEPRTNLQATPAPAGVDTTNANFQFVINQPGSYYLSANLAVTKPNGIQINAEGVTLDLNGFQVSRGSGSGGDGIQIPATAHRFRLLNGSIKGFAFGINTPGTSSGARASKFRDLDVSGCTSVALVSGPGAFLESCDVHDNTGTRGFSGISGTTFINCTAAANTVDIAMAAGVGATLINCTASSNTCTFGIYADGGSTITNCNALGNTSTDTFSCGIGTGTGCTITSSTAYANYSSSASFSANTGIGFAVGSGNTIQGCAAANNRGDGIQLLNYSLARGNSCVSNGSSGDGAGIHVTSSANRIEANNVSLNDRGIDVADAGNVITSNTARQNTTNYKIGANNVFGAIVDRTAPASVAVNGNSAPSSTGTTDPLANISY
jgi:parallel beta-helix repeat protein